MTLGKALELVAKSGRVRRAGWASDVVVEMLLQPAPREALVMIWTPADASWHPWVLSVSDVRATDWELAIGPSPT